MKSKLRISRRAIADIEAVLAYTLEHFGETKHAEYRKLIGDALKAIAVRPDKPPARHRPELHPDARTYHIARKGKRARHFIVYRIARGGFVDVARLLHDSMDLERHLPEGFEAED